MYSGMGGFQGLTGELLACKLPDSGLVSGISGGAPGVGNASGLASTGGFAATGALAGGFAAIEALTGGLGLSIGVSGL